MKTEYIAIILMMIIALMLLYYGFISFIKSKGLKKQKFESTIDVRQLVQALGKSENILDVASSPSKVTVQLKDTSLVDAALVQSLGASGVVEGKDSLAMIFGRQSSAIAEDLRKLI